VGIKSEKVAEGLDSDDGAGDGIVFRNRILDKDLQRFPGATAQIGKKLPVIQKVAAEDFRDADTLKGTRYETPARNLLEDIHAEPFPEFHHAFLMCCQQSSCCVNIFDRNVYPPYNLQTVNVSAALANGFNDEKEAE